jgi:hypothetical protein
MYIFLFAVAIIKLIIFFCLYLPQSFILHPDLRSQGLFQNPTKKNRFQEKCSSQNPRKYQRVQIKGLFVEWYENETIEKCISKVTDNKKLLEPVCCKKQQQKVPDQLLFCRIGDL